MIKVEDQEWYYITSGNQYVSWLPNERKILVASSLSNATKFKFGEVVDINGVVKDTWTIDMKTGETLKNVEDVGIVMSYGFGDYVRTEAIGGGYKLHIDNGIVWNKPGTGLVLSGTSQTGDVIFGLAKVSSPFNQ